LDGIAKMVKLRGRLIIFLIAIFLVVVVGMTGFYIIKTNEGDPPNAVDAFSWSIITLSTLGAYSSDTVLNSSIGKLFTSFKSKPLPIPNNGHVIICGYNEIIDETIDAIKLHNIPYVVIEKKKSSITSFDKNHIPYLIGDPTNDDVLKKAKLDNAIALIAAMDDETNSFICLSARKLKNNLRIIAIADKIGNVKVSYAAGANRVITPKILAGTILGRRACHEYVVGDSGKFTMFGDIEVRQYEITPNSPVVGMPIKELESLRSGTIVIGLLKEDGLNLDPKPDIILDEGSTVLIIGNDRQLNSLQKIMERKQ
jgi:voltage-gated potassium channel